MRLIWQAASSRSKLSVSSCEVNLRPEVLAMTLANWVDQVEQQLVDADLFFGHGTDNAFDEAAWLVMSAAGIDSGAESLDWQQALQESQLLAINHPKTMELTKLN